jgi:hypothetical protein
MTLRKKPRPKPRPGSKPWRVGVHDFIGSAVTGGIALGAQLFHAMAQVATSDNIAAASNKNTTLMAAVAFLLAGVDLLRRIMTDNRKGPSN